MVRELPLTPPPLGIVTVQLVSVGPQPGFKGPGKLKGLDGGLAKTYTPNENNPPTIIPVKMEAKALR